MDVCTKVEIYLNCGRAFLLLSKSVKSSGGEKKKISICVALYFFSINVVVIYSSGVSARLWNNDNAILVLSKYLIFIYLFFIIIILHSSLPAALK